MKSILKKPSAWLPIAMSSAAFTLVFIYVAIFGISQQPAEDEGTAAHLFQLLMAGQVPIILFFAMKYLPKHPKVALQILLLQFVAGLIAFAPVFFFEM
jgi:hypothetical protein